MARIRYRLTDREWGYAWVLLPHEGRRPFPVVVALHQTVPQGKDEPVGIEGDAELAYGRELVERGFAVVAPDAIGFGERRKGHPDALYRSADEFFAAHPSGSVMGKMIFDVRRLVDLLEMLPEIDASRIGCIGHSHGGYGTLFAMLFEPRICAGVISCGLTMFESDPTPDRWWRKTALIPRLGFYEGRLDQVPYGFREWLTALAPRWLMMSAALDDAIFPETENLKEVAGRVKQVYTRTGVGHRFRHWVFRGPHCFPSAARARAYRMLARALDVCRSS
jgi:dienelactone hydrolase